MEQIKEKPIMELSKDEIKAVETDVKLTKLIAPAGQTVRYLIIVSHGRKTMHDSGYPYIKIIGVAEEGGLVDLGWHDHFICEEPVNIDSLGKNVFRIMPWGNGKKPFKVSAPFISCSTFEIGTGKYITSEESENYILLK